MINNLNDVNKTILVIDDNPTNLGVLTGYLKDQGYQIMVARDGRDGIEKAKIGNPDLILLDLMMPDIDGFETCTILKSIEKIRDIPIIFITASDNLDNKVKGFKSGGVDYITKPFQLDEVLARVNTHLSLRDMQIQLENKIKELHSINIELNTFAHTVAHDLKNHLCGILGYAKLLDYENYDFDNNKKNTFVQNIYSSATKMNELFDGLMLLSGVRNKKIDFVPLNMEDIISEVLKALDCQIKTTNTKMIIPESWPSVLGYQLWIEDVWTNYISNAIKYGGTPPIVELGYTLLNENINDKSFIKFWVRDNGAGISPENQKKLFTPFTRLDQSTSSENGIGLTIVQQIVEKLGGTVGIESEEGAGSIFFFTLPLV